MRNYPTRQVSEFDLYGVPLKRLALNVFRLKTEVDKERQGEREDEKKTREKEKENNRNAHEL